MMTVARIIAVLLIAALCFSWGMRTGQWIVTCRPDYTTYDAAQLSWVAEGILERANNEVNYIRKIQQEKMLK